MVNAKKMEKLPEGWNSVKLEEVGDINMGQSPPSTEINEKEIGVPFLQGNAEFTNKYPVPQKWIKKPLKLSKKGDILISIRAPVGAINKADRPYCIGRGLAAISFKAIDEKFGWFGLIYWKHQLENLSQGSTFEAVSKNDLNNLLLLIPISLLEQRKIAEILETVDNSIEKTDKIIEKYKRIKQGLMQVLLTKGIVESDELGVMSYESENGKSYELRVRNYEARNKSDELGVMSYEAKNKSFELADKKWEIRSEKKHKFKDSPLGRIPEEWEVVELGEVALVTKLAGFEYTKFINYSIEGEIILIRALNIKNGKLNLENIYTMPKKLSSFLQRSKLLKNDLVFTYVGTLGEVALIPENNKFHLAPNVARISFKNGFYEPRFILQLFLSHFVKKQIDYLTSSTTQAALSMANIRKIKIFLPPFSEQYRIASILTQIDEVIEKEQKYKAKLERIKQGLMEDFLTGKVRVEV